MSAIAAELAVRFDAAVAEVVTLVEGCSDEEWRLVCLAEGWSMGVVVDHIAVYMLIQRDWIGKVASEEPMVPFTNRAIDAFNAWRAEDRADVTKAEVFTLLEHNRGVAHDFILSLTEEQLRRSRPWEYIILDAVPGERRTVAECIERTLIAHVRHHQRSIERALGR